MWAGVTIGRDLDAIGYCLICVVDSGDAAGISWHYARHQCLKLADIVKYVTSLNNIVKHLTLLHRIVKHYRPH